MPAQRPEQPNRPRREEPPTRNADAKPKPHQQKHAQQKPKTHKNKKPPKGGPPVRTHAKKPLLHLSLGPKVLLKGLQLLLLHLLRDLSLHLLERRRRRLPHIIDADDMPAKLRMHRRIRHLAFLQLLRGSGKLRHISLRIRPVEVATILARSRVLRELLREVFEARASLDLRNQILRLLLVVDEDVVQVIFL